MGLLVGEVIMIKLKGLTKEFNNIAVVDNIDLEISRGLFFALLGPNGAGKTTTIRMMVSLLKPTSGEVLIDGKELTRDRLEYKKKLGLVAQHISLEKEMSARENLELHCRLHKIRKNERNSRIKKLLKFVDLWEHRNKLTKNMSGGMKRRLMIARAILHRPQIIFMDEPTVGLDPVSRRKIWDLLKGLNKDGITVIMTTHYIEEAEILCNEVALMDKGSIIARGTPEELKNQIGKYVLEIFTEGKTEYKFFAEHQDGIDYARKINKDFTLRENTLEDVFIKLTDHGVGE